MLGNGMGGIDWAGVPVVLQMLGVQDVEDCLHRMMVIKSYSKPGS